MKYYFRPSYSIEIFFVQLNISYYNYTNPSKILYIIEGNAQISLRCVFVGSLCNYKSK